MSAAELDIGGAPAIIGAGVAGLTTALCLAPEPVVLVSGPAIGTEGCSVLAQGGLAASLSDYDSPELHLCDTLAAGDGFCDQAAVTRIVEAAPTAIERLERFGAAFDRDPDGAPRLGLEAAHSCRRIVHAAGDATGRELMRALTAAVRRTPSITVLEGMEVRRLIVEDGAIAGLLAVGGSGAVIMATSRVVLATGGIGGLYYETTNPPGTFGHGLALAACAGAELADLEFVQFHPTALDRPGRPMTLVSEAVRGEGAVLVDDNGRRILDQTPGGELAPRDVVARAVWRELAAGHRVFLDASKCLGPRFGKRFPAIAHLCREAGIDPATEPIPVRPAAHYHMGGVAVDAAGRSTVAGLWACGEVACTGLHGANRLASNSLTEAVVMADHVAESIAGIQPGQPLRLSSSFVPPRPDPSPVRPVVSVTLGIVRDGRTLRKSAADLLKIAAANSAASDPVIVALMMTMAALSREESRGSHYRSDFPDRNSSARPSRLTLATALQAAIALCWQSTDTEHTT